MNSENSPTNAQLNEHPIPDLEVWKTAEIEVAHKRTVSRLSFRRIGNVIAEAFNLDRGFIYTFKELSLRPAQTIRRYLDTDRFTFTNPISYFLVIVGITIFIANQNDFFQSNVAALNSGLEAGMDINPNSQMADGAQREKATAKVNEAFESYFVPYQNIWSILTIFFTSIFSFLFFRKSKFNFTEHFVINLFIFSHTYIIFLLMVIFKLFNPIWSAGYIAILFVYSFFAYQGLFLQSRGKTIFKTISLFVLSYILFLLVMIGLLLLFFINS